MTTKVVCWNIARRNEPWHWLLDMDADVALLQEAAEPPLEIAARVEIDPAPWDISGGNWNWRTAIVRLSNRVRVDWITSVPLAEAEAERGDFAASWPGTLTAARVTPPGGEPFIVISMYAWWENPHSSVGNWIFSDATAHRVISDLSGFIGGECNHRILAAGDLNSFHGYHPDGAYWADRYQTVFTRMDALGVPLIGPQAPHGRQADPWPDELPRGSKNVPTFHSNRQTPATATRQLDYVFASRDLADSVHVRALNEPDEWGPSDHCRLEIHIE